MDIVIKKFSHGARVNILLEKSSKALYLYISGIEDLGPDAFLPSMHGEHILLRVR